MPRLHFNRIFWKIFAVIWLANSAIILVMGYVLLHHKASDRMSAYHQQQVQSLAQIIIQRYEAGKPMPRPNWERWPKLQQRFELPPRFFMEVVINDSGKRVFRFGGGKKAPKVSSELLIMADSGREYRVSYSEKPLPHFIARPFRELASLQSALLLLAAALISGVLSWQLVRPIKALAAVGNKYRLGVTGSNQLQSSPLLTRGDELGDLARALNTMFMQTEATFKAQQNLLHDVSHELRAPLARLQVAASLAEREQPDSANIHKIHTQCGRINSLIQQILDFARIDESTQKPQSMDLNALTAQVVEDVRFEFPERNIRWQPCPGSAETHGEPELLVRALENILRNACKHTAPDVLIEVSVAAIAAPGRGWRLSIRDHGVGILEAERDQLIQPFYRSGQQMHTEGFGLGLSIAARAIAKQAGMLKLTNHSDGGLQVEIDLP